MRVRIVNCSNDTWWYKDEIGKEYDVWHKTLYKGDVLLYVGVELALDADDCEIIEE